LRLALDKVCKLNCPIVVTKLDRLSGDVAFLAGLMAQHVPFVVANSDRISTRSILHLYPSGEGAGCD
jgi:hypothetical protein